MHNRVLRARFLRAVGIGALLLWVATAFCSAAVGAVAVPPSAARTMVDFDEDWRFSKGDFAAAMAPGFDDAAWGEIKVPHDWSSEGPFGAE